MGEHVTAAAGAEMTTQVHPLVAAVVAQTERLQSALDDQLHKMKSDKFTGTDEGEAVEVTVDGRYWLTDVFIDDGLLRLGAERVQQRINEALQNALIRAIGSFEADRERLYAAVGEIAGELISINAQLGEQG
ncbi:YbaB/EbfC family nucleoid-associated protein [Mycobacterium sp.]|uniref:YbaB/EbfC family nucleoid-associated protein n=1 Tax=Mycobacterium sp. TaxID=1785 RepID=UPI0031D4231F